MIQASECGTCHGGLLTPDERKAQLMERVGGVGCRRGLS